MRAWPLLALLAAGCGDTGGNDAPAVDEIERLSTPENVAENVVEPARLDPLGNASLSAMGAMAARCRFEGPVGTLLVAGGDSGVAMVDGAPRQLVATAPAAPTGGFFEDRQISISVGRTAAGDRLTLTNRRTQAQAEITGRWMCVEPTQ